MKIETIKEVLMRRDNLTEAEAEDLIFDAKKDLFKRLEDGDPSAEDICYEWFGLEPDYLIELL